MAWYPECLIHPWRNCDRKRCPLLVVEWVDIWNQGIRPEAEITDTIADDGDVDIVLAMNQDGILPKFGNRHIDTMLHHQQTYGRSRQ